MNSIRCKVACPLLAESRHSEHGTPQALLPSLEHYLKVDAVRIEDVGGVVTVMVVVAYSRRPVVAAARRKRGTMELIDRLAVLRRNGKVDAVTDALTAMEPDRWVAIATQTNAPCAGSRPCRRDVDNQLQAKVFQSS